MSPTELQSAISAAKSMVARGEIKTLPSVPCGTTVYHAVGAKTDRGLYKKRPTGKVTQAEYAQLCAQGLTVQGTPRKRRPYELRHDLSQMTPEERKARLKLQKRRYVERRNKELITVCDKCLRASCWQGVFMCEESKTASVVQKTRKELRSLRREDSSFWKTHRQIFPRQ